MPRARPRRAYGPSSSGPPLTVLGTQRHRKLPAGAARAPPRPALWLKPVGDRVLGGAQPRPPAGVSTAGSLLAAAAGGASSRAEREGEDPTWLSYFPTIAPDHFEAAHSLLKPHPFSLLGLIQ